MKWVTIITHVWLSKRCYMYICYLSAEDLDILFCFLVSLYVELVFWIRSVNEVKKLIFLPLSLKIQLFFVYNLRYSV